MVVGFGLRSRFVLPLVAACFHFSPGKAFAAVPIEAGTWEIQAGLAGIVLPEDIQGTYSLQPEARLGFFIVDAIELQAQVDVRVWPLGSVAPNSYGFGGSVLWFPSIQEERNLYLLGGVGGAYTDPPGSVEDSSFDPLGRAGFGFKVPITGTGLGFLDGSYLNLEYRGEMVFVDDPDFVSGAAIGLSFFPGSEPEPAPASVAPPAPVPPPAEVVPPKEEEVPPPGEVVPPKEEEVPPPPEVAPPKEEEIAPPKEEEITPPEE